MKDGKFEIEDLKIEPLSQIYNLSGFDCGDCDLNEFLKVDSLDYKNKKLAETTLLVHDEKVVGFFSLCTDAIKLNLEEKEICTLFNNPLPEFPAIKIVRLGVDKNYHNKHIGKIIIQLAIGLIRNSMDKKIGCRFITVDSYHSKVIFYQRFGFKLNEHDKYLKKQDYVSMRFDLLNLPQ